MALHGSQLCVIPIVLEPRRHGIRLGVLTADLRSLLSHASASLVLAARGLPTPLLRRKLAADIKIAPVEQIGRIVMDAEAGIALRPQAEPPPQTPAAAETTYFALDRSSRYFRDLAQSGGIAVHLHPEEWMEANLELALWAIAQVDIEELRAAREREAKAMAEARHREREQYRRLDAADVRCPHCGEMDARFKDDAKRASTPYWICNSCGRSFRRDDFMRPV